MLCPYSAFVAATLVASVVPQEFLGNGFCPGRDSQPAALPAKDFSPSCFHNKTCGTTLGRKWEKTLLNQQSQFFFRHRAVCDLHRHRLRFRIGQR